MDIHRYIKNVDDNNDLEYTFYLNVIFKNGEKDTFYKVSNTNYATMIYFDDMVDYNSIKEFTLTVSKLYMNKKKYILNSDINNKTVFQNKHVYLEFIKGYNNYVQCLCNINYKNKDRIVFTPPTY